VYNIRVIASSNITKSLFYFASWKYQDNNHTGEIPRNNSINATSVIANYTSNTHRDKLQNATIFGYTVTV